MGVRWSDEAVADLEAIFRFILESSPQNALLVDQRIQDAVVMLGRFPTMGRSIGNDGMRELVVERTGYIVRYAEVEGDALILAVASGRQKFPAG